MPVHGRAAVGDQVQVLDTVLEWCGVADDLGIGYAALKRSSMPEREGRGVAVFAPFSCEPPAAVTMAQAEPGTP